MKPPLLFLCHRLPYPPNKGDKIRSFHLLKYLAEHFDIYLATFVDEAEDWCWMRELESYCREVLCRPLNPLLARLSSLRGLLCREALSVSYYRDRELREWVESRVARHGIDRALVFSSTMGQYVTAVAGLRHRVVDFVDVDSDKWRQYAEQKPWPLSYLYRREAKLLLAYEQALASCTEASLFVSSAEAALFRRLAPACAGYVGYFSNGVDTDYFQPDVSLNNPYGDAGKAIVFTGAMDYWPNIDAVSWFAQEVLPSLRKIEPSIHFYIVGRSPNGAVSRLARLPGVVVTGTVEDVRPYLQYALAAVAPMRIARGIQNKVLEAMAMAKPVLVSPMGLEGIDARHSRDVLVAKAPRDYVEYCRALLGGSESGLGERARAHVLQQFSWEANLASVRQLLLPEPPLSSEALANG